ncbi:NAD(P)-binding protein [Aaosphaeria arxii CBS 175.79]|uniref:NAD(P)-binding protein n=1 Tax=Aaosphaeria arxii CBS 175.79 TaxID=1450172 RepID=A0A6A5XMM5_9PLEO|nr:NAD(P)-binding protein [Aaosphaeria arxii CBS 175.79]KAF2014392.1 NAD(P)-binding protein [Aaosphaeria arxii CBS 175.79]
MTSFSDFNKWTTAGEVAKAFGDNLHGRNVIITGVNPVGIGFAIAEAVASQEPALVVMTYRSKTKSDEVIEKLRAKYPNVHYRPLEMDLSSQMSIRAAAKQVNEWPENIDLLFNNAGVMSVQERTLIDGVDVHFATNHLGHFLFTNLILHKLQRSAKTSPAGSTRVVNVSGGWHALSPVRFDDLNFEGKPLPADQQPNTELLKKFGFNATEGYSPEIAYAQSKTSNILFSLYLTQHLAEQGILSFAICPGGVMTDIGRHYHEERAKEIYASGILDKTQDQGAAPALVAALDPALKAGTSCFLDNCQLKDPARHANDPVIAERLWHLSEELVRERFVY